MSFLSSGKKASIVITGGGKGIGLALAKNLLALGHEVIVSEREQNHLEDAKKQCPDIKTCQADIRSDQGRKDFANHILSAHPNINVLINNAGSNHFLGPLKETSETDWDLHSRTVQVNLMTPIHLSTLFLPHFLKKPEALIANVTDLAAYVPVARYPTYSATKAGLHSFTMSLRHQLKGTPVQVVEIIPPAVNTPKVPSDLPYATNARANAVDPNDFAKSTIDQLIGRVEEIGYQGAETETVTRASRDQLDVLFAAWNSGEAEKGGEAQAGSSAETKQQK